MPTARRRTTPSASVVRRRDRTDEVEDETEEVRRTPRPEDYDDDTEPEPVVADDDTEEEPAPRPRRRQPVAEDEEEEPAPRKRRAEVDDDDDEPAPAAKKTGLPPGVRVGDEGVAKTMASRGSGADRVRLDKEPILIKFLEPENFVNFSQHWVPSGPGQPDRPYICFGLECPICDVGDRPTTTILYNVLEVSDADGPRHKILQIGTRANQALTEVAEDRKTGKPNRMRDYYAVSRSGVKQQSQTNFRPVKGRDLEDDWSEIFTTFGPDDLDDIIAEETEKCLNADYITGNTKKQLQEVAKYLTED